MDIAIRHIQVNDRVRLPVIRLVANGQPPEEFLLSLKDGFQRGQCEGFSEMARAREEVSGTAGPDHVPDVFRLIHVQEVALYQVFKRVNAAGKVLHTVFSVYPVDTVLPFSLFSRSPIELSRG